MQGCHFLSCYQTHCTSIKKGKQHFVHAGTLCAVSHFSISLKCKKFREEKKKKVF